MLEESWSKFVTYSKRQQKAYLSYRRMCLHFLKGKLWAGIPLSFHLADITPVFILFLFYFCDLYTISLCVQKSSPGSEVPPHSAQPLLLSCPEAGMPQHGDALRLISGADKQQASDPGFPKGPLFKCLGNDAYIESFFF